MKNQRRKLLKSKPVRSTCEFYEFMNMDANM